MAKKKKKNVTDPTRLSPPLLFSVASSNECTGICPTVPQDDQEARAYRDVASIPVTPKKDKDR